MKKFKLLITALFYFKIIVISAQGFGINAGGNFANLNSEQAQGNTNTGLNGGLRFDIPLVEGDESSPIRFSPEIFIKQSGSNEFISNFQSINYQNLDLTYIGLYLPITFGFGSNDENANYHSYGGVFLQGSLFLDYASGANKTVSGFTDEITFSSGSDRLDFGFSFNVQFLMPGYGGIKLGYNYGLNNIKFIDSIDPVFAKNKGLFFNYTTYFGD